MPDSGPLVSLDKLSEPLTKLVEVVAAGIGTLYAPFGTMRQAKADAKAAVVRAEADVEVASIQERARTRLEHREALRQRNLEAITSVAANELPATVSKEPVDIDWTLQYIDQAQDVCDEQLQALWARILAGEVASPGSYSKRTLAFLKTLDKWEAEALTLLCSFAIEDDGGWPVIIEDDFCRELMREEFHDAAIIGHFDSIGILASGGMMYPSSFNGREFSYFGSRYRTSGPEKPKQEGPLPGFEIPIATHLFSAIGKQLSAIAGARPIEGFVERLSESLARSSNVRFEKIDS